MHWLLAWLSLVHWIRDGPTPVDPIEAASPILLFAVVVAGSVLEAAALDIG